MDAFILNASLICKDCAMDKKEDLGQEPLDSQGDPLHWPQGPYPDGGGEADSPQHCDLCGLFLQNPLTEDGEMYVSDHFDEYHERGQWLNGKYQGVGNKEVINQWTEFYDYLDLSHIK